MNRRAFKLGLSALLAVTVPCMTGCFDLKPGETKTAEDIVKSEPKVVPRAVFAAKMDLDGSKLIVSAKQTCALVEMQDVKRTSKTSQKLESGAVGGLTALAVLGSVPLTGGIIMLADSPKVFSSSRDSRTYNPTGKGATVVLGGLLTAIGAVAVTIPIVNAGRAASSDTTTNTEHREGKVLRSQVACDGTVVPQSLSVTAQAPGVGALSLGATDPQGNMSSDLKIALASWFTGQTPPPVSAGIFVNGQFVGEIHVADIARALFDDRAQQDELAWSQAEPQACASQKTDPACARVKAYATSFPAGRHIDEALRLAGPVGPTQAVVAANQAGELLQRAVAAAVSASNTASNKIREQAESEHQKALLKSEQEAVKAGKTACIATCKKVCEEPLKGGQKGVSPDAATTCKTSCAQEACP